MESVEAGVIPVYFDWRFSLLEKSRTSARRSAAASRVSRVALDRDHDPPQARGDWVGARARRVATSPSPRCVRFGSLWRSSSRATGAWTSSQYDASRCVPTRKLLDELGGAHARADQHRGRRRRDAARRRRATALRRGRQTAGGARGRGRVRRRVVYAPRRFAAWAAVGAGEVHRRIGMTYRGCAPPRGSRTGSGAGAGAGEPGRSAGSRRHRRRAGALGDFLGDAVRPRPRGGGWTARGAAGGDAREDRDLARARCFSAARWGPRRRCCEGGRTRAGGGVARLCLPVARHRRACTSARPMDDLVAARNDATVSTRARPLRARGYRRGRAQPGGGRRGGGERAPRGVTRDDLSLSCVNLGLGTSKNIGGDARRRCEGALATLATGRSARAAQRPRRRESRLGLWARRSIGRRRTMKTARTTATRRSAIHSTAPVGKGWRRAALGPIDPNVCRDS